MNNSFSSVIESATSLQIILPTRPFFDQVASGLSLYLSLREKKDVSIYSPAEMTVEFNRLVGVNKISNELGNKNLVLKFKDYYADNIERVSYDIENGEFKLTVVPKPGAPSPKKEQMDVSYAGISADTAILIGGANENHFPDLVKKEMTGIKLIHIGTKELITSQKLETMSFAKPASSVSEIVATLLKDNDFGVDSDVATNLLMGIEDASGNFTSPSVGPETFEMMAYLLRKGGKRRAQMGITQRTNFPKGSIPGEGGGEKVKEVQAPNEWKGPKIYKGTSVS